MRTTALKLLAVVIEVIVLLAGLEFYLRTKYTRVVQHDDGRTHAILAASSPEFLFNFTEKGRRLRPGVHVTFLNHWTSHRDVDIRINSLGFRGAEMRIPKPPGTRRILFLGDSITCCDYLPENECFVDLTGQILQKQGDARRVETINAGVEDIGTREELDILEESGLKTDPDVVVLCFYLNDSRPPWGFPQERGYSTWLRRHSVLASLIYHKAAFFQWIHQQGVDRFEWATLTDHVPWKTKPEALLTLAKAARFDWGAAWDPASWNTIDLELKELQRLSETHHFRVLIAAFPVSFQVYADYLEDSPQRELSRLADKYQLNYLDLLPVFRQHRNEALFFDGCHPRPNGNRWVAKAIAETIDRQHLLPEVISAPGNPPTEGLK